jgi:hypothetical protein
VGCRSRKFVASCTGEAYDARHNEPNRQIQMKKRSTGLSLPILSVILPLLAAGQSNPRLPPIDPASRIIGANPLFATIGPNIAVARVPFQAKRVGRSVQKLGDGSTVAEDIVGQIARDSDGRVRVDEQQGDQPLVTEVLDPVTSTSLRWISSSATATQSMPFSRQPWHVTFPSQTLSAAIESNAEEREPDKITKENLGTKTVNGLVTSGTRITTVVSTGKIVHEVWFKGFLARPRKARCRLCRFLSARAPKSPLNPKEGRTTRAATAN